MMRSLSLFAMTVVVASMPCLALDTLAYTIRIQAPGTGRAEVSVVIPTHGARAVDLVMPIWSPGYYAVQNYAKDVESLGATSSGRRLEVEHPVANHWRILTNGAEKVELTYRLICQTRFVSTNWIGPDLAVLTGPATFLKVAQGGPFTYEVRIELPQGWKNSATGMEDAPDHAPGHFTAPDYDTLLDCPIVAGNFPSHAFRVAGTRNELVDIGNTGSWNGAVESRNLARIVEENRCLWGVLPYRKYVFINVFGPGAGGLEHATSSMLSSMPPASGSNQGFRWYSYVSHEFFHGYNVKRLRPVELGPFDYERPPRTAGLWVAEGITTYYGPIMAVRAGLGTPADFLNELSGCIRSLQNSPGRHKQTLEDSSLNVWDEGGSGVGGDPARGISYYIKGPVVAFVLDARIRTATRGKRSLDDLMRLAYRRFSGAKGFTEGQFRATAGEVAGCDLDSWFHRHLASTEEIDYSEALTCFGLRFAPSKDSAKPTWKLEPDPAASEIQKANLSDLLRARAEADAR
jgi:predicted metalloprotease with PDZ domain